MLWKLIMIWSIKMVSDERAVARSDGNLLRAVVCLDGVFREKL